MENQTGFDLERSLTQSMREFAAQPCYAQADLREMEDHLRESVRALEGKGLSAEEAFLLARRRLGGPSLLDVEFSKVNQPRIWLNRVLWMLVGIQAWVLFWDFGGTVRLAATVAFARLWLYQGLWSAIWLALVELGVLAGLAAVAVRWTRSRQAALSARVQWALSRTSSAAFVAGALLLAGLAAKFAVRMEAVALTWAMPVPQYGVDVDVDQYGGQRDRAGAGAHRSVLDRGRGEAHRRVGVESRARAHAGRRVGVTIGLERSG